MTNPITSMLTGGSGIVQTAINTLAGKPAGSSLTTPSAPGGLGGTGASSLLTSPLRVGAGALQGLMNGSGAMAGAANAMGASLGTGMSANPNSMVAMSQNATGQSEALTDGMQDALGQTSFNSLKNQLKSSQLKMTESLGSGLAQQISKSGDAVKQMFSQ